MGLAPILSALAAWLGQQAQGQGGNFFQGAPIEDKALIPPGFEDAYAMAGQKAMGRMEEPRYVAPINPLSMGAANIASQFYQGQPFQMPGLQQYMTGQGGLGGGGAGAPGAGIPTSAGIPGTISWTGPGMPTPGRGSRVELGGIANPATMPGASGQYPPYVPRIPFPGMPNPMGGAPWMTPGRRIPR